MARKPTSDELGTAIEWLRNNESDDEEGERCRAVADWLEAQETQWMLRREARAAGVPVDALRRRLAQMKAA